MPDWKHRWVCPHWEFYFDQEDAPDLSDGLELGRDIAHPEAAPTSRSRARICPAEAQAVIRRGSAR